jgi:pimeloyl-ACP methyl ester carboxylesterase
MSFTEQMIDVDGASVRVWRAGSGPKLTFLAGFAGLPKWAPFLDRLAETHSLVVPSLPGFPGAGANHNDLDDHLDWIVATRRILLAADALGGDLVGSSIGGALAAEIAALWPDSVKRLTLISPMGLYIENDPTADPWAQRGDKVPPLMAEDADAFKALRAMPEGEDATEWKIMQSRADAAGARLLWPLGDTRLAKRLKLIEAPTLLLWGSADKVQPTSYAGHVSKLMTAEVETRIIDGAGHLAWLDKPVEVAAAILLGVGAARTAA